MKHIKIGYDKTHNICYIDAKKSEFIPRYLEYMLEHLKIPKNAIIIFLKDQSKEA